METSNILEMLNSYFFGDGDVDVNELASALLDSNQKDNKLRQPHHNTGENLKWPK